MVWQPLIDRLPEWIEAVSIDLPGHGVAHQETFNTLEDLASVLSHKINQPAIWIGWSLGGQAVMQLALTHPEKVKAMCLVTSSPRFVYQPDWEHGMEEKVFDSFAEELEKDFSGTIRRFLTLQVRGSESGRNVLKNLREKISGQPAANINALRAGLSVLKTTDMRSQLTNLTMPVSWVLGERDTLINSSLVDELKLFTPHAEVSIYKQAGHAPFLSHLEDFSEQLISFVKEHS